MWKNNIENLEKVGSDLFQEGRNQGRNQWEKVGTEDKILYNNELGDKRLWITVNEGRNRLGISDRVLRKHCSEGHFVTRKVKMNGGDGYLISVESMFKYYSKIGD